VTDSDERREPVTAERCRRDLDKSVDATVLGERVNVAGPVTDSGEGRDPAAAERYRRRGVVDHSDVA
jgi:hypothetical protein